MRRRLGFVFVMLALFAASAASIAAQDMNVAFGDAKLRELSGLKPGDKVNVTIHEGGVIVITPLSPVVGTHQARMRAEKLIKANRRLFRRLA